MRFIYNILIILTVSSFLFSCGGFKLKKKADSGEEFLIEKKDPLILPPDYDRLPLPDTKTTNREEKLSIETIISGDDNTQRNTSKKSSVEKSIEEELRKN